MSILPENNGPKIPNQDIFPGDKGHNRVREALLRRENVHVWEFIVLSRRENPIKNQIRAFSLGKTTIFNLKTRSNPRPTNPLRAKCP